MKGTAPTLVREMFALNEENRYKLRNRADFTILTVNSVRYGRESLSYLRSEIWEMSLLDLKRTKSLSKFHAKIKKWSI